MRLFRRNPYGTGLCGPSGLFGFAHLKQPKHARPSQAGASRKGAVAPAQSYSEVPKIKPARTSKVEKRRESGDRRRTAPCRTVATTRERPRWSARRRGRKWLRPPENDRIRTIRRRPAR